MPTRTSHHAAPVRRRVGAFALFLALASLLVLTPGAPAGAQSAQGYEPSDVQVVPGDGTLTVTWSVTARPGWADDDVRHALRWSQEPGVWANPKDPLNVGRNDGITVAGGVSSYTITGLDNGVATGVFVRSYVGQGHSESEPASSPWVRVKGDHTTPRAGAQQPQQQAPEAPAEPEPTVTATAQPQDSAQPQSSAQPQDSAQHGLIVLVDRLPAEGGAEVTVTVGLKSPAGQGGLTATLTAGGTATAGSDYALSPDCNCGSLSTAYVNILEGATAGTATITVTDDSDDDDNESIILDATAGSLTAAPVTLTITDNDNPAPQELTKPERDSAEQGAADEDPPAREYSVPRDLSGVEGSSVTLTITLSENAPPGGVELSVTPKFGGPSRAVAADVGAVRSPVWVAAGSRTTTVEIPLVDDAAEEQSEWFRVDVWPTQTFWDLGWYKSGPFDGSTVITIIDNDQATAASYVPNPNCDPSPTGDYDTDDDGLIEVCSVNQFWAINFDLNGDGRNNSSFDDRGRHDPSYAQQFPNAAPGDMGCPASGCVGYELIVDLDLDGLNFGPIGYHSGQLQLIFEGNGHTISNFSHTNLKGWEVGLISDNAGVIRNLGVESADVTTKAKGGALVGANHGTIINSYATGTVTGRTMLGGLAGSNTGTIADSYADVDVRSTEAAEQGASGAGGEDDGVGYWPARSSGQAMGYDVGALVGYNAGAIRTSYATGDVSGKADNVGGLAGYNANRGRIFASYATGDVSSSGRYLGGLVGSNWGPVTASYAIGGATGENAGGLAGYSNVAATASYWDTAASGLASSAAGAGQTTSGLQTPTGYSGIYAGWNLDLNGDGSGDDPWDFGTSSQYPVLSSVGPGVAAQRAQFPTAPTPTDQTTSSGTDYDADDDGLIEVSSLAQLNAVRWDLDGDGTATNAGYAAAFSGAASGMGCPASGCAGYELAANLDFDTNSSSAADAGDAYWNSGKGWTPIGHGTGGFAAVFEGNDHTVRNLFISSSDDDAGLFSTVASGAVVRDLTLESVSVSAQGNVGALAGQSSATVAGVRVSGAVSGRNAVGGLIGYAHTSSLVSNSRSSAAVTGTAPRSSGGRDVGGLIGYNEGAIRASRATGTVSGQANNVGGLVGLSWSTGSITASYATGDVSSSGRYIGGLVGSAHGDITASYAAGATTGGTDTGGLAGYHAGTATNSYWDADASQAVGTAGTAKTTAELQRPTGYTGIYADWNVDLDGDGTPDDPWHFGTPLDYPTLK